MGLTHQPTLKSFISTMLFFDSVMKVSIRITINRSLFAKLHVLIKQDIVSKELQILRCQALILSDVSSSRDYQKESLKWNTQIQFCLILVVMALILTTFK